MDRPAAILALMVPAAAKVQQFPKGFGEQNVSLDGVTIRALRPLAESVTVVLPEQRRDVQVLMRRAGITVHPQQVGADSAQVTALVGDVAPFQAPAVLTDGSTKPANAKKGGSRGRGSAGARRPRGAAGAAGFGHTGHGRQGGRRSRTSA